MKKHIANIITAGRIIFSFPLLLTPLSSTWFYVLYLFCGFTDMIDGTIARKTGSVNNFGARLDTASDFVFMLVCCVKLLPEVHLPVWLWVWIILIASVKIFDTILVLIRDKKLLSIHSVLNKITGFALFLLPLSMAFLEPVYGVSAVCLPASLTAIEEVNFIAKKQEVI